MCLRNLFLYRYLRMFWNRLTKVENGKCYAFDWGLPPKDYRKYVTAEQNMTPRLVRR